MSDINIRMAEQNFDNCLISQTAARFLVPFIQLFGLYVIVHGHYSPGGGFQGGALLGASFILLQLAFGLEFCMRSLSEKVNLIMSSTGALIFVGTGILCTVFGGLFLDYSALDKLIPLGAIGWRSFGIFVVEVGVGITVMGIMASLFWDLSSAGELDEGL